MPEVLEEDVKEKKEATRCSRITTAIKYTQDPPHLVKSTTARPVQNIVCGFSSLFVLLMMGIMMPETC
jgi:hypothetical protein